LFSPRSGGERVARGETSGISQPNNSALKTRQEEDSGAPSEREFICVTYQTFHVWLPSFVALGANVEVLTHPLSFESYDSHLAALENQFQR
jgi:hypothetical protein